MAVVAMSVVYVLTTLIPEDDGDDPTVEQVRKRNEWDNDDYVSRGLILKGMSDFLFDIYRNVDSSKELWDFLEAKYMAEDALTFMLTSKPNDSILWHARLGHVHFKMMQDMSKDGLIPASDMDTEKWFGVMGERGIECIIVGYAEHSKAFRFYVIEPNDSVLINSIIESNDAIFDENRFSSVPRPSQRSLVNETEDIGCLVVPEEVTKEVVQQPN
ncbi:zinc finger, CCHC-type containing protein [Tanacetum coccineum]